MADAQLIGDMLGEMIMDTVRDFQLATPRTQQHSLGMSELGGCREYIRASIMTDEKHVGTEIKWPAFVGSALGAYIEDILDSKQLAKVEEPVTLKLDVPGIGEIELAGSADAMMAKLVLDFKSKSELDTVRREGPSFKEKVQISGYLIGAVQMGKLDEDSTGHLVYIDRSGRESKAYVWSTDYEQALAIMEAAKERLQDVAHAIATSQQAPRDERETWCRAVQCPFYAGCWGGYTPTGALDHAEEISAVEAYVEARDQVKSWTNQRDTARDNLRGMEGVTPDGTVVQWKIINSRYGEQERLEVTTPK